MLPQEIRKEIINKIDKQGLLTDEQQRLILNYAEGKTATVADKLSFFKVTKCDKVMRAISVNTSVGETDTQVAGLSITKE